MITLPAWLWWKSTKWSEYRKRFTEKSGRRYLACGTLILTFFLEIPDWFWEIKDDDPIRSYLATNLGKWTNKNQMAEQDHHSIFAIDLTPTPGTVLHRVGIHKLDK